MSESRSPILKSIAAVRTANTLRLAARNVDAAIEQAKRLESPETVERCRLALDCVNDAMDSAMDSREASCSN